MIFIITILISLFSSIIFFFIQEQQGGFAPGTQSITHGSLPAILSATYIYSMTYCHQQHAKNHYKSLNFDFKLALTTFLFKHLVHISCT
jgi:hypothetical protein